MVDINIDADIQQAVRKMQEGMDAIQKVAENAAKGVGSVGTAYDRAAVSASKFNAEVKKALKADADRQAKAMQEMADRMIKAQDRRIGIQNEAADRRAAMANLAKAGQAPTLGDQVTKVGQAARETFTSANLIQGGGDAVANAVRNFGPLAAGAAAVTTAFVAGKFAIEAHAESVRKAADRLEEMAGRRADLGKAAASLGLSGQDVADMQKAGGLTTVDEQERFLGKMGEGNTARPFGAPRLGAKGAKKLFDAFQKTGVTGLADLASNPVVSDENAQTFIDQEMVRQGADIRTLGGPAGSAVTDYANRILPDVVQAKKLKSQLSEVTDRPNKDQGDTSKSINTQFYDAYMKQLGDTPGIGNRIAGPMIGFAHALFQETVEGRAKNALVREGASGSDVIDLLKKANDQRDSQYRATTKPPRPSIGRQGDQ